MLKLNLYKIARSDRIGFMTRNSFNSLKPYFEFANKILEPEHKSRKNTHPLRITAAKTVMRRRAGMYEVSSFPLLNISLNWPVLFLVSCVSCVFTKCFCYSCVSVSFCFYSFLFNFHSEKNFCNFEQKNPK